MPTTTPLTLALVALFVPAGAALLIGIVAPLRRAGKPAAYLAVAAALASLFAALSLFQHQLLVPHAAVLETVPWLPGVGRTVARLGIRLDGISVPMLVVVTGVASMVQIFSLGYMADEPKPAFGRYFGYHSLFIFSMNLLVLAPNLLQLFMGWELVGLTSYLLIGFYWSKPSAARAAVKAFWVTKFADMGLVIGLITLYRMSGGFDWNASLSIPAATLVSLLLFVAVMGKSAQFPLHVWLPDAMEGPTPVSALLHAATMVAAGVYLVVRANPLFAGAPGTQMVMVWVGSFTALFAAVVAVVQTDIKKVLAYSTCSQLGYMIAALGAGSLMAGYFHLTTHAFFKALLFLGAGSVIHAVHSNELSSMGGLAKKMKLTTVTFVVGALALAGFPGFSGFFSKDLILEALYEKQLWGPLALLMLAAFLTAFYMGRVVFLAFFGKPSEAAEHAHESGISMGSAAGHPRRAGPRRRRLRRPLRRDVRRGVRVPPRHRGHDRQRSGYRRHPAQLADLRAALGRGEELRLPLAAGQAGSGQPGRRRLLGALPPRVPGRCRHRRLVRPLHHRRLHELPGVDDHRGRQARPQDADR